jgi:hypothetical protein
MKQFYTRDLTGERVDYGRVRNLIRNITYALEKRGILRERKYVKGSDTIAL